VSARAAVNRPAASPSGVVPPRRAAGQTASKPLGANGTLTVQLTKVPAGATAVHIHNALGSVDVVAGLESYYG
jgi:hypothetical protein